ncbi:DNA methyltransferase [Paraglaciecola polaris]|uniref:site-specific DNA-methyltransferase (adenine-specific) n=1 Tax=Paraglaciecola polaris LMG 21857 TaxID=1129793 RepID=K6ZSC2_9ALTE|nr:DNA methyltransferase [Paraglaciecola polaris]GAC31733.1 hypothetical protein GPLA_0817 [Paraglaciecola polaris LMG 21857]
MSAVKKLNIVDIENGLEELAKQNLSPVEYGKGLVALFAPAATTKRLGTTKANTSDFENGILWREKLHYVPCKAGELNTVIEQVKTSDKTLKAKVRLVVVNDGSNILVFDRKYNELTDCTIETVKDEPQLFLPLTGQEGFRREEENEVDIKATGKLAKLYDALIEKNPDWLEDDKRHVLNHFITQVIFCLFAEDTGIFPKDIFTKTLKNRAGSNGENATEVITGIYSVLDLNDAQRTETEGWQNEFPYVNGGLFSGDVLIPEFTPKAYRYLLEASSLDWKHINPDILGSSIQAIVDPTMRGSLGMHYTSVPNILKTLEPLFLNELRDDLLKARHSKKLINLFLERLSKIVLFDPACGSGNFLVIAYRELRKLELQAMDAVRDIEGGASMAFGFNSVISLSNFYGIEYADFAAETAKLALWIAEYQQNSRFVAAFGAEIPALPLRESGNILCANSLQVDWSAFCSSVNNQPIFLVGNPPYLGSTWMNTQQKEDMKSVFSPYTKNYKTLDYVCAWFLKGAKFLSSFNAKMAFVATNSITQGSQVATLWPIVFDFELEIFFAYKSFKWSNNASNNAAVICVIVGVQQQSDDAKVIFEENDYKNASNINGYLLDAPNIVIQASQKPINRMPLMQKGNQPTDGGNLILSEDEKNNLVSSFPELDSYIKKIVGSKEIINGGHRYCLWFSDADLDFALNHRGISTRIAAVREMRLNSPDLGTRKMANKPHMFRESRTSELTLGIPSVSSENRAYLPAEIFNSSTILTNLALAIYDAQLWHFSVIVSKIHYIWITTVCGRLKTDFRYSSTLGWHTFPIPELNQCQKESLIESARKILLIRESYYPKNIAELYDRKNMPEDLRQAHQDNDELLESFYQNKPFVTDEDRLAHLFARYVEMTKGVDQ